MSPLPASSLPRSRRPTRSTSISFGPPQRPIPTSLPVELLDAVLALFAPSTPADRATLAACTLVSRTWRAFARPRLHARARIARPADFADVPRRLRADPQLAGMVRSLELAPARDASAPLLGFGGMWALPAPVPEGRGRGTRMGAYEVVEQAYFARRMGACGSPRLDLATLAEIVACLPRLQELSLVGLAMVGPPPSRSPSPAPSPSSAEESTSTATPAPATPGPFPLRKLTIARCQMPGHGPRLSAWCGLELLALFPAQTAHIAGTEISGDAPTALLPSPPPPAIRDFALSWENSYMPANAASVSGLLAHLAATLDPATLERLTLASGWKIASVFLPALGALVRAAAVPNVRRLDLGLVLGPVADRGEDRAEYWEPLNLRECGRMEAFTVTMKMPSERQASTARIPLAAACAALVSQLPRGTREVIVKLRGVEKLSQLLDVRSLNLSLLDDVLANMEAFPELEKVTIEVEDGTRTAAVILEGENTIAALLPRLQASNLLSLMTVS
ncbi:uncharacterized protein BXZ73DRAFT_98903 [Epithele typhae]|uniref:uncharacterized protein n=1 Tax=Epithele typhae TaxID=378194 RepID=UPI00200775E8|nr:uncharacterized protein BXZ73DRAFT_98903 [Epithele typhae]KAH9940474.1 hypothetical protein BXZ73DRAFT_98903 [Epithele typhae]